MDIIKFHLPQDGFRACHLGTTCAVLFSRYQAIWLQQWNKNNSDLISNGSIYGDMY